MEYEIHPEKVDEVIVRVPEFPYLIMGTRGEPYDLVSAPYSLPYVVSIVLNERRIVKPDDFALEKIMDHKIRDLAKKVKVLVDKSLTDYHSGIIQIKTINGEKYEKHVEAFKGDFRNPLTEMELKDKFRALASTVLTEVQAQEIINVVNKLEKLEDVTKLTNLLIRSQELT